jgi:tRNA(Arg) A34 adenosine deaminase TadA
MDARNVDSTEERDLQYLRRAITLSEEGVRAGEAPFGAMIVATDGRVLSETFSTTMGERDPTAHAEVRAIRLAARAFAPADLADATLYASAEPCAMCAAAIYWAKIPRVVFAASEMRLRSLREANPATLALTLSSREVLARGWKPTDVVGPLLEDEAMEIMSRAWNRRGR